ncbi:hypothetical protein, partial [Caballeronia sp. AAUFL_F1_KS45]|uniref:hypothetical protein n=1 Tax=Caballeronia sp. AAUFL_F1_KS45 TaxID=2921770 RepID=UPI002028D44D
MQKIGDEAAGCKDVEDMVLAIDTVIDRLNSNQWEAPRKEPALAGASVLAEALALHSPGTSPEAIRALLDGMNLAEKKALKN